eukprot:TRINITY_DN9254_c0_g1_i1.p1 TRINITY_DN9254_c0_g1~~TRINITY_DN9254_c0_g1_i1.p1  ORF type:complete len:998 (+),score=248.60 TRINITY_DN9254_c0_g1_i1:24-2996(+)
MSRARGTAARKEREMRDAQIQADREAAADAILALSLEEREKALDDLYRKYDENGDGTISVKELKACLKSWGIALNNESVEMVIQTYDADPSDPTLNEEDMKHIMRYYLSLKENFIKYDADRSNSVSRREFANILPQVGFNLEEETVGKIAELFDDDGSGDMDFAEFASVMFYLKNMEKQVIEAGKEIDPSEFHAMLRAFDVKMSPRECKFAYEKAVEKGIDFSKMDFSKVVDLVALTKENSKDIIAASEKERKEERANLKITGVDAKRRMRSAVIFTAQKKAEIEELQNNKKRRKIKREIKEAQGGKWEDPNFPTTAESLFPVNKNRAEGIEWLRPNEMVGVDNPDLCIDGVDEGDVCQGALGDCWFLSALSTIAQSGNDQVQCLFVSYEPLYGFAQCRFWKDGEWKLITVDDRIPCKRGRPCFARCRDLNELWVPLVEKAYAKLHGSYENIESGIINNALVDLTGEPSESMDIHPKDTKWEQMKSFVDEGFFMGCANASSGAGVEEDNGLGILANHAYGVLEFIEVQGKRLVKCRNPWGKYEWKGRWSDGAKEWTPSIIQELDVVFADDGTFYMSFEDWKQIFNRLYVLRIYIDDIGEKWEKYFFKSEWTEQNAGGCMNFPTFSTNPQYLIRSEKDTQVFASILQPCHRYRRATTVKYEPVGIAIAEKKIDDLFRQEAVNATSFLSNYPTSRENCMDFELEGGKPYLLIPHTYHNNVCMEYYLSVFSQYPITFEELTATKSVPSIDSAFTEKTAGGCTNHSTWVDNPQYTIKVNTPGTVVVTLTQNIESRTDLTHIGLYAWKTGSSKKNLIARNNLVGQSPITNAPSVEVTLANCEPGKYTVMPCTFNPGLLISYTLKVEGGDSILKEAQEILSDDIRGEWSEGTDGGCKNHGTWKSNPVFPLDIPGETVVTITLNTNDKTPMGFYVLDKGLTKTVHSSKFANTKTLSEDVTLQEGEYVVLPATFNPGLHAPFRLQIFYQQDSVDSVDE